jgi:hypothetical protein
MNTILNDKVNRKLLDRIVLWALFAGIIVFGFILADSASAHDKMLHFSAHFGMSFVMCTVLYAFSSLKLHWRKLPSFMFSISATLLAGCIYKYLEIIDKVTNIQQYPLKDLIEATGCYTSMSQNIAGVLATMFVIKYFFSRQTMIINLAKRNLAPIQDFVSSERKFG